jgi:hypothetical protein
MEISSVANFCRNCGAENKSSGKFCSDCGTLLRFQPETTVPKSKVDLGRSALKVEGAKKKRLNSAAQIFIVVTVGFLAVVFIKPPLDAQTNKGVCEDFNDVYATYLLDSNLGSQNGLVNGFPHLAFSSAVDALANRAIDGGLKLALEKDSDTIGNLRKGRVIITPTACKQFTN